MNSKITVIGAGKLAKSFVLGLLKKGYSPEFITVVYRTNHDVFKGIKVNFTKIVPEDTNLCIFMVRPQDVGGLSVMVNNRIDFFNSIPNIFIVSGIKPLILKKHIKLKKNSYVVGTMNTNIENNEGLIVLGDRKQNTLKYLKIFELLGTVLYTDSKNVLDYVTIVGSGNALDIMFIKLLVNQFPMANISFKLKEIRKCLENHDERLGSCCEYVDAYILAKTFAIKNIFKWYKKESQDIANRTLLSTLNFFKHEHLLTTAIMERHLETVVTKKGCTEEGLKEVKHIKDFISIEKIKLFYTKVSERANIFEQDILLSIAESQNK